MKSKFKVIAPILLIFIGGLIIGGCSREKQSDIILTYAGPGMPEEIEVMNEAFREFEKINKHVKVKFVHAEWNAYWSKVETMIAGGTPPDVMYMGGGFLHSFAKKGALVEMDEYIRKDKQLNMEDFFAQYKNGYMYKGKIYGIPRDVGPFVMFYNKEIFDKENVPYPDETWDWDKLIEQGKKLTRDLNNDGKVDQYAYDLTFGYEETMRAIWGFNGRILNKNMTRSEMNSGINIKVIKKLKDLIYRYKISPTPQVRRAAPLFETGRIAIHPDGYWMIRYYQKRLTFKWGVGPVIKGLKRVGFLSGTSYSIPKDSKNKEMAWKLVKYLTSHRIQKINALKGLAIPVRKKTAYDKEVMKLPYMELFVGSVLYSQAPPFNPDWNEMISIYNRHMEKIVLNLVKVEQGLDNMNDEINALLAK